MYYEISIEENNLQELDILLCYVFNFLSCVGTLLIAEILRQNQNEYFVVYDIQNHGPIFQLLLD